MRDADLYNPDGTPIAGQKGPYGGTYGPSEGLGGVTSVVEQFPAQPQSRGDEAVWNPAQGGGPTPAPTMIGTDTTVPLPRDDPRGRLPSGGFAGNLADPTSMDVPGGYPPSDTTTNPPATRLAGPSGGTQPSPGGTVTADQTTALNNAPSTADGSIPSDVPTNTSGFSGGGGGAGGPQQPLTADSLIRPINDFPPRPGPDGGPPAPDGGPPPFNSPTPPLAPFPDNFEQGLWGTPNPAGGLALPDQPPFQFPFNGPIPNDLNIINGRPQVPLPAPDGTTDGVAAALNNAVDIGP
jgi:hypothetical protein